MNKESFPEHWNLIKLGNEDYFERLGGGTPRRSNEDYWNGDIKWLTNNEAKGNIINKVSDTSEYITKKGLNNSSTKLIPKKSVILSCTASIGKVVINQTEMATNQQFNSFICNKEKIIPEFLAYYFLTIKSELEKLAGKTTFLHLTVKNLEKIEVPIPPMNEQKEIIAKLDELFSNLEAMDKLQQRADEIGENIMNAAIDSVIGLTKYQDDHPKEWEKKKLNDISKEIITGGTPKRSNNKYFGGDIVWLRLADVHDKKYVYESEEYLTEEGLNKSSAKIIPENSVILSTRATIGEVVIAGKTVTTNQGFKSFVCGEKLIPEYLYYYLIGSIEQIKRLGSQTTYPEVSKTAISNFEILVPSLNEQKKIIDELNDLRNSINMIKEQQEDRDVLLEKLPQSILKKAFAGELV
ncbi:restriction endonuclease subunit S [Halanaerobium congolense]|jgi:type I restriction enzyme S subunit|nr:restriction endonuclease subunit S [Halanaerobium congolense]